MPRSRPVFAQHQMPITQPAAIMTAQFEGVNNSGQRAVSTANDSHANRVPAVPGMMGDKPLPKPCAMKCAGCEVMKRALGLLTKAIWPGSSVVMLKNDRKIEVSAQADGPL